MVGDDVDDLVRILEDPATRLRVAFARGEEPESDDRDRTDCPKLSHDFLHPLLRQLTAQPSHEHGACHRL